VAGGSVQCARPTIASCNVAPNASPAGARRSATAEAARALLRTLHVLSRSEATMDVAYLGVTAVFFAVSLALVELFDRL
jgi:hypothetical protein